MHFKNIFNLKIHKINIIFNIFSIKKYTIPPKYKNTYRNDVGGRWLNTRDSNLTRKDSFPSHGIVSHVRSIGNLNLKTEHKFESFQRIYSIISSLDAICFT